MKSRRALLNELDQNAEVVDFFQNRPYTFVRLVTNYNGNHYYGYGFSKVMYPDKWDDRTGHSIAMRHALIMVLHQIRTDERGQGKILAHDDAPKTEYDFAVLYHRE